MQVACKYHQHKTIYTLKSFFRILPQFLADVTRCLRDYALTRDEMV